MACSRVPLAAALALLLASTAGAELVPTLPEELPAQAGVKDSENRRKSLFSAFNKAASKAKPDEELEGQADGDPNGDAAKAEGELTQALGRLFALEEKYPDLKSSQNVLQLQEELTSTENKVGFARQLYNDVATQYNTRQAQFPTSLVAGLAKASPAELWEVEDASERAVPKVDLSFGKPAA